MKAKYVVKKMTYDDGRGGQGSYWGHGTFGISLPGYRWGIIDTDTGYYVTWKNSECPMAFATRAKAKEYIKYIK